MIFLKYFMIFLKYFYDILKYFYDISKIFSLRSIGCHNWSGVNVFCPKDEQFHQQETQ